MSNEIIVRVNGWDLVASDGKVGEAKIRDIDLAERLMYRERKAIRKLIKRLIDGGFLAGICVRDTVSRTQMPTGGVRETTVQEYYLTESEALLVISKSDTEIATSIMQEVIAVYMAVRQGLLSPASTPSAELAIVTQALTQLSTSQNALIDIVREMRETQSRRTLETENCIGNRGARIVSLALATYSSALSEDKKTARSIRGLAEVTLRANLNYNGAGRTWALFPAARWSELKTKLEELGRLAQRCGTRQLSIVGA